MITGRRGPESQRLGLVGEEASQVKSTALGLTRLVTRFPVWDVSYLVAVTFVIGLLAFFCLVVSFLALSQFSPCSFLVFLFLYTQIFPTSSPLFLSLFTLLFSTSLLPSFLLFSLSSFYSLHLCLIFFSSTYLKFSPIFIIPPLSYSPVSLSFNLLSLLYPPFYSLS